MDYGDDGGVQWYTVMMEGLRENSPAAGKSPVRFEWPWYCTIFRPRSALNEVYDCPDLFIVWRRVVLG